MSFSMFSFGRVGRDAKAFIEYPLWRLRGSPAPDNHVSKKKRIKQLAKQNSCETFIETGTFYGQMVSFAASLFKVSISIEIYEPFYKENVEQFKDNPRVAILFGNSASMLRQAIEKAEGRILFWLDGHYSGAGTGFGGKTSPILEELALIAQSNVRDAVIVIDDKRLFDGSDGYPTEAAAREAILAINSKYKIMSDGDAFVAVVG